MDHFDLIAPLYDLFVRLPVSKQFQELLNLPVEGLLLDAGGGTGRVSHRIRAPIGKLIVCDLSHAMLRQAKVKKGLTTVRAKAEQLPFADNVFERVVIVDALHHFHDQQTAIRDLVRVLKPGGRMVIEEPDRDRFLVKLLIVAEQMAFMRSRILRMADIAGLLMQEGLVPCIVRGSSFASWVVADKATTMFGIPASTGMPTGTLETEFFEGLNAGDARRSPVAAPPTCLRRSRRSWRPA